MIRAIHLRYQDLKGLERHLRVDGRAVSEHNGVVLACRIEPIPGGYIAYASTANRSGESVRLRCVCFELDTGLEPSSPARFFKHGYQSWSASHPVAIGHRPPLLNRSLLARISHQSEAERPPEAPEGATSELFTIVESDSSPEHFLCGFIVAANQFTTITVTSAAHLTARALFDGAWLMPGETVAVEPIAFWRSDSDPARMAAQWADLLGKRMNARVKAPYQRGWCSWYYYFDGITEDAFRSNLHKLRELRRELPLDVVQIDDGYQAALGDWDNTNQKFPSGLKKIAAEIAEAGFTPGLWTAPFLATRDSELMRDHPDWLICNDRGDPAAVANNPNWTTSQDKFAYALDSSHPEFIQHLEQLFDRLVHQFGYGYLKIDFLFAAAAEGRHYNPRLSRAQVLRCGLEAIRRGAGDEAFILGCGCPLGPAIGVVDGMRIGPDVAPYWGGDIEPGTRVAIDAIVARSFMHRRLWLNDPDCLMLRSRDTRLSQEERFALASAIAISGGMLILSDDVNLIDEESKRLFHVVAKIGMEADGAYIDEAPVARNLMGNPASQTLVVHHQTDILCLLLNTGDSPQEVSLAELSFTGWGTRLVAPGGELAAPETIELPAHSGRIIRSHRPVTTSQGPG
jgi:alpha-galactosidase